VKTTLYLENAFKMLKADTNPLCLLFYAAWKHTHVNKIRYQLIGKQSKGIDCTDDFLFTTRIMHKHLTIKTVCETIFCSIEIETRFLRLISIFLLAGFHRNTSKSQTFSI